jgi:aldose 1-epimerase
MKKTLFAFIACSFLLLVSCGKKEVETETLSGLLPSNFAYITEDGKKNQLYVMKNANGMEVAVINIGARIVSVMVPDKTGEMQNVVVGFDNIQPYLDLKSSHGAIIGRFANRIAGGKIEVDRITWELRRNDGNHTLHGGPRGFRTQYFTIEQPNEQTLICSYFSKHKEEGFPGNLNLTVTYTLTNDNSIDINYEATTDLATVVNFTSHSFFQLSKNLDDQLLYINASNYTPTNEELIPTGKISPVRETAFDFTTQRALDANQNYDLNYVLNNPGNITDLKAKLISTSTGISMEVYTTEPGLQLFVKRVDPSICLETQHFPDSPNHSNFPSTILRVDSVFSSQTIYKFSVEN